MRKVSPTIGGGDTERFAIEHACRVMRRGARADGMRPSADDALEAGPTVEELELLLLPDSTDSAQDFRDKSRIATESEMVKRARKLEMHVHDRNRSIKGGSIRANYRSRLVCQETRGRSTIDVTESRHVENLVSQISLGDESEAVVLLRVRMTDEDDGQECDAEGLCLVPMLDDAGQLLQQGQV